MEQTIKYANSIKRIEIPSLWSGRKHIRWELNPDVNILSGRNGEGKSTILNRLVRQLRQSPTSGEIPQTMRKGVTIDFSPADATTIRYDIIRSFDRQLIQIEGMKDLPGINIVTELDWQLYLMQRRYLDYQVNVGNRMVQLLTSGAPDAHQQAVEASASKTRFQDIVDDLFSATGKRLDRNSNELRFIQYNEVIMPYLLSSGEKQMLLILLTALTEDRLPYVLFMDEPEASLHYEWQECLVSLVRELNPMAQIVLTTHSPALILKEWQGHVTEVSDITLD